MNTTYDSRATRFLLVAGALAVLATGCGGNTSNSEETEPSLVPSGPGVVAEGPSEAATAADTEPAAAEGPAEQSGIDDDTGEASSSQTGGEIAITAAIEFDSGTGTFEVHQGADIVGCEAGSFADEDLAANIERTLTCELGERTGTFTVQFRPEPDESGEPGEFTSEWTVEGATGDFVGLQGGGDWAAVMHVDESGADESWSGEVVFGTPHGGADGGGDAVTTNADDFAGDTEAFLVARVDRLQVPDDQGAVLVSVHDADGTTSSAAAGNDSTGNVPEPSDAFRGTPVGHLMTVLTTLSLVDDDLIGLDDLVSDHVTRVVVPDGVTVRDLLQGTSGIPDYVSTDGFIDGLLQDQGRRWTPEEIVALVADLEPESAPGTEQGFSNTNGVVAGILIEEITGRPVHEVMRDRVIVPAGMMSTYYPIAEDGPAPFETYQVIDDEPVLSGDFDDTAIETSAWVFGAISSADDVHALFTAVDAGTIISPESLAEMTAGDEFGFGVELIGPDKNILAIGTGLPGTAVFVAHMPETGRTAFFASTSDVLRFDAVVDPVLDGMLAEAGVEQQ